MHGFTAINASTEGSVNRALTEILQHHDELLKMFLHVIDAEIEEALDAGGFGSVRVQFKAARGYAAYDRLGSGLTLAPWAVDYQRYARGLDVHKHEATVLRKAGTREFVIVQNIFSHLRQVAI
jgi:hypothetical protein